MSINLVDELNNIYVMLDPDEYPETHDRLEQFIKNEDEGLNAYDLASVLIEADRPIDLPDFVLDFIVELYEYGIENDDEHSMNDLGAMYYDGKRGFEQSFEKAVYYYDMAAMHGSRQAQENLWYCYYYGRVGEPDYAKAFHYFALGAFDGHLISLYKIGDMYLNGYYVPKNEKEAFFIYMRCLETMTDEAADEVAGPVYLRLGNMFLKGLGVEANYKNALVCYQKAESFLYDMVSKGDYMYNNSLRAAISGQAKAREKLMEDLPEREWTFDRL